MSRWFVLFSIVAGLADLALAERPSVDYIFPAGGQRGTTVAIRVGAHYLHGGSPFTMDGLGVDASKRIEETSTTWFEGPMIFKPASQRGENYPRDHAGQVIIASDAPLGIRDWRIWTSQGVTPSREFIVGDLVEVIEDEVDGRPIPQAVQTPTTINGRIFPREDVDIWTFQASEGETITCRVVAHSIGSPLDSVLELYGPSGRRLAENDDSFASDSQIQCRVSETGTYRVHIFDNEFRGGQPYVYRLTVTRGEWLNRVFPLGGRRGTPTDFELTGNDTTSSVNLGLPSLNTRGGTGLFHATYALPGAAHVQRQLIDIDANPQLDEDTAGQGIRDLPVTVNGRIGSVGEHDHFPLDVHQAGSVRFQLLAQSLGSPLDAKITLSDAEDKVLVEWGDRDNPQEIDQTFTFKKAGRYVVQVASLWHQAGGMDHAYRLKIEAPTEPDFQLSLATDAISVDRGETAKLKVTAKRIGGFNQSVSLSVHGLPSGVTVTEASIAKGKAAVDLILTAAADAKIELRTLQIVGTSTIGDATVTRSVQVSRGIGNALTDRIQLMVCMPTPFTIDGIEFQTSYGARGTIYRRHFVVHRNGYTGRLTVRLADRQVRHLQGITGTVLELGETVNEFDYPVYVSTWLEMNRTSRTVVMAIGSVTDETGKSHTVSFTSGVPKDQIILLTAPSPMSVRSETRAVQIVPNSTVTVPITINRGQLPDGPVTIELILPAHFQAVKAPSIVVDSGKSRGALEIQFGSSSVPFNMPVVIRATTLDANGDDVIADTKLELVLPSTDPPP
jgi:hypothetical protein